MHILRGRGYVHSKRKGLCTLEEEGVISTSRGSGVYTYTLEEEWVTCKRRTKGYKHALEEKRVISCLLEHSHDFLAHPLNL